MAPHPQPAADFPPIDDKAAWRAHIVAIEEALLPLLRQISPNGNAKVEDRDADGARVFDITPAELAPDSRGVVLDMHGGGLILCGGELCRMMGLGAAGRLHQRVLAVDYRMPPDHPYPAALDDALAAYRALLRERSSREIVISGASAGGNLAAA